MFRNASSITTFLTIALRHLDEDIDLALGLSGNYENVILEE